MDIKPKLIFIGRQYHNKTQSDQTILSLLKPHFDVTVIRKEQFSDRECVEYLKKENPDIIFFWCLPPSITKHLRTLKCKMVWAPMCDGFKPMSFRKRFWFAYHKVHVLCFSKLLSNYFSKTRMPSTYVKCSLKPQIDREYKKEGPYTLFLWQREDLICVENIVRLIGEKNIKKIITKSEIGPQNFKDNPFEIEVLPDWLEKKEYISKVLEADFYIAPRVKEGIGFSFLEPMSLGIPIIGYNDSTMNEYIIDGKNGYLFDDRFELNQPLKSPHELSKGILEIIQKDYDNWQSDQQKIPLFVDLKNKEALCAR